MKRLIRVALVLGCAVFGGGVAAGQARLGLHVVDANAQKVGYVLDSSRAVVFIDGVAYATPTGRYGFFPTAFPQFYPTVDCSGPAYMASSAADLFDPAWYTSDGLFHYPSPATPQPVIYQSGKSVGTDGVPGSCSAQTGGDFAVPVASVAAPVFTPPFRVVDALQVSPAPPVATFNDVPTGHPFFQFIEALAASGITAGCQAAPPLYCPDTPLTRGQMAVFLSKALGL